MKTSNNKAFTLLETLVTVAISTAIIAGVYTTFIIGNRTWVHYADTTILRQEVRKAVYWMSNELREAKDIFIVDKPGTVRIDFYKPKTGYVSYTWSDEGEDAGKIIRMNYEEERTLAKEITLLKFSRHTTDEIIITMATGEDNKFRLVQKIALRAQTSMFKDSDRKYE